MLPHTHVQFKARDGKFKVVEAAQVIGLAVELAHKKAREIGLGNVSEDKLPFVTFSPAAGVKVKRGNTWCQEESAVIQVSPDQASVALAVVNKQRKWFSDMGLNIWHVDVYRPAVKKGVDMIADFSNSKASFGIAGLVLVELKVFTVAGFQKKLSDAQGALVQDFQKMNSSCRNYSAALLVVAKIEKNGTSWCRPLTVAWLWHKEEWTNMSSSSTAAPSRGKLPASQKPPAAEVWAKMAWPRLAKKQKKVGRLVDFLRAVNMPAGNPGKRAASFNLVLADRGVAGRITQEQLRGEHGVWPYVASKAVLRVVLQHAL